MDPLAKDRVQRRIQWILTLVGVSALGMVVVNTIAADRSSAPVEARQRPSEAVSSPRGQDTPISSVIDSLSPASLGLTETKTVAAEGPVASEFDCLIEPYYLVDIGSPVTGVIETVNVERGDSIERGQVLLQLESTVERASVAVARGRADMDTLIESHEARVALGEQRRNRADKLAAGDALSRDRHEEAETEAILARLELEQSREKMKLASLELDEAVARLDRRSIRSPLTGIVVERLMAPGEVVDDETVMRVAQIDPLRVQVVLPGAMFGSFRKGARAHVQPELPGSPAYQAEIVQVDRLIDAASGTFGIQLELPNPSEAIPGGVHCQVRFEE